MFTSAVVHRFAILILRFRQQAAVKAGVIFTQNRGMQNACGQTAKVAVNAMVRD